MVGAHQGRFCTGTWTDASWLRPQGHAGNLGNDRTGRGSPTPTKTIAVLLGCVSFPLLLRVVFRTRESGGKGFPPKARKEEAVPPPPPPLLSPTGFVLESAQCPCLQIRDPSPVWPRGSTWPAARFYKASERVYTCTDPLRELKDSEERSRSVLRPSGAKKKKKSREQCLSEGLPATRHLATRSFTTLVHQSVSKPGDPEKTNRVPAH